jgi:hypothetical protein
VWLSRRAGCPRDVRYHDISPDTIALLRQARHILDEQRGRHLDDDDELLAVLASSIIDGGGALKEDTGQARGPVSHVEPQDRAVGGSADVQPSSAQGAAKLARAIVRSQARDALVGLGWKPGIARRAIDAAFEHLGDESHLERVISASLRECMTIVR